MPLPSLDLFERELPDDNTPLTSEKKKERFTRSIVAHNELTHDPDLRGGRFDLGGFTSIHVYHYRSYSDFDKKRSGWYFSIGKYNHDERYDSKSAARYAGLQYAQKALNDALKSVNFTLSKYRE